MEKLHRKLVLSAVHMLIVVTTATHVSKALLEEVVDTKGYRHSCRSGYRTVTGAMIQPEFGVLCADICIITMALNESENEFYADCKS